MTRRITSRGLLLGVAILLAGVNTGCLWALEDALYNNGVSRPRSDEEIARDLLTLGHDGLAHPPPPGGKPGPNGRLMHPPPGWRWANPENARDLTLVPLQ
jgi:hypothetical protein